MGILFSYLFPKKYLNIEPDVDPEADPDAEPDAEPDVEPVTILTNRKSIFTLKGYKKALLIGINYQNDDSNDNDLNGCADDAERLKKYLTKCVEKGMLRNELQYFINKDKSNVSKNILLEYGQLRSLFLESIDSTMLHHFMELDMLDSYSNPLSYKNDNESLETHRRQQVKIMNSYVNLIDSLGYPSESNVGHARIYYKLENETGCRWEDCFKYCMKYYNDIHFSDENLTVITAE